MKVEEPSNITSEPRRRVCISCGKASESKICEQCAERIRMEALAQKKREEQGNAWSHWE